MTAYTTRSLAAAIMGEDEVEANAKAAGRELRKFLRAEAVAKGGKVGTDTPGKGGRYSIDLNKRELTAMTKRFNAWKIEQEAEKKARRDALEALKANKDEAPKAAETDTEDTTDKVDEADIEDEALEGPTDEEIAAMLSDDDNED